VGTPSRLAWSGGSGTAAHNGKQAVSKHVTGALHPRPATASRLGTSLGKARRRVQATLRLPDDPHVADKE
jgi:hypothetical protein